MALARYALQVEAELEEAVRQMDREQARRIAEAYTHVPEGDESEIETLSRDYLALLQELEEAKQERDELEERWLGMRDCYDCEVLRVGKAEQRVKELEEALGELLVHIPNGRATDPYKVEAYRALAGSVEEQKPLSHLRTTWDKVAEEQKPCPLLAAVPVEEETRCICKRFSDLREGTIIADLTCPVHGVDGTDPGDVLP